MPFEEALYFVVTAGGVEIEVFGVQALKNEAGF